MAPRRPLCTVEKQIDSMPQGFSLYHGILELNKKKDRNSLHYWEEKLAQTRWKKLPRDKFLSLDKPALSG